MTTIDTIQTLSAIAAARAVARKFVVLVWDAGGLRLTTDPNDARGTLRPARVSALLSTAPPTTSGAWKISAKYLARIFLDIASTFVDVSDDVGQFSIRVGTLDMVLDARPGSLKHIAEPGTLPDVDCVTLDPASGFKAIAMVARATTDTDSVYRRDDLEYVCVGRRNGGSVALATNGSRLTMMPLPHASGLGDDFIGIPSHVVRVLATLPTGACGLAQLRQQKDRTTLTFGGITWEWETVSVLPTLEAVLKLADNEPASSFEVTAEFAYAVRAIAAVCGQAASMVTIVVGPGGSVEPRTKETVIDKSSVVLDALKLREALYEVDGERVELHGQMSPVVVRGRRGVALVMPCRPETATTWTET